jgi:hypothetical protein
VLVFVAVNIFYHKNSILRTVDRRRLGFAYVSIPASAENRCPWSAPRLKACDWMPPKTSPFGRRARSAALMRCTLRLEALRWHGLAGEPDEALDVVGKIGEANRLSRSRS